MSKERNNLSLLSADRALSEAESTHKDIVGWQASLQAAMFGSVTEDDVASIVKTQVDKAKAGDMNAINFVFANLLGTKRPVNIKQTLVVTDVETAARLAKGDEKKVG